MLVVEKKGTSCPACKRYTSAYSSVCNKDTPCNKHESLEYPHFWRKCSHCDFQWIEYVLVKSSKPPAPRPTPSSNKPFPKSEPEYIAPPSLWTRFWEAVIERIKPKTPPVVDKVADKEYSEYKPYEWKEG